ncbi:MAG: YitT family protein, partial [Bacteroidales bacterium]|nr:YitT family protein [Bacteroidales bacterium]
ALMINKYWPVSLSKVFLISDIIIVAALLFLPDKAFTDMVYGLVEIITFSAIIDYVVGGDKSSYQLLVFSDRYADIADHIINNMNRGVTVLSAQGWYTKKDKNVLLILINRKQLPSLTKVIKEVDPRAFMSVSSTNNVYGEGFDEIKTGFKRKNKSESDAS